MSKTLSGLCVALSLTACATTTQYVPKASMATLKDGEALVRVHREQERPGAAHSIEVTDNGLKIGAVSTGKDLTWSRPAGIMEINLVPITFVVRAAPPIKVEVKPGKIYDFNLSWSTLALNFVLKEEGSR